MKAELEAFNEKQKDESSKKQEEDLTKQVEDLKKSNLKLKDQIFKNESIAKKTRKEKENLQVECQMIFQEFESA